MSWSSTSTNTMTTDRISSSPMTTSSCPDSSTCILSYCPSSCSDIFMCWRSNWSVTTFVWWSSYVGVDDWGTSGDERRTSDDDCRTTGGGSLIVDCVLFLTVCVWDVSSPCNCSEAKELAKSLAFSITFVVSSSSLSKKRWHRFRKNILYFC